MIDQSQYEIPNDLERAQLEILQLKHQLASGEPNNWCVYADNNYSIRCDTYAEAKAKFDTLSPELHPYVVLWVRIGTAVRFCYKAPKAEVIE